VTTSATSSTSNGIDLYWIPLGAGGHVVSRCGRVFERVSASREHRAARPLYHAALEVTVDGRRLVIEMGPAWGIREPDRGVVLQGPVGLAWLGGLQAFRYEVRCWPGGRIPDLAWAERRQRLSNDVAPAARVIAQLHTVPALTWGRDELRAGEMWNSNSLVSWLLSSSGVDLRGVCPPRGGRAPGWAAGLVLAGRRREHVDA
jgi:hypothetical protein